MLKVKKILLFFSCVTIAVIFAMLTLASEKTANHYPVVSLTNSIQEISGEDLYKNNCARCHGNHGEGGKGPNLASKKKQAKWKNSDEKLVNKIIKGDWGMPGFGKKLKIEEIKAVASYVRTFNTDHNNYSTNSNSSANNK